MVQKDAFYGRHPAFFLPSLYSRPALALQKPTLRGARDAASDEDTIVDGTEGGERERVPYGDFKWGEGGTRLLFCLP